MIRARLCGTCAGGKSMSRVHDSGQDGDCPGDFIALSRRILHFANLGVPRIAFLREVSAMLFEFTGCDRLGLQLLGARTCFVWRASSQGQDALHFEERHDCDPDTELAQLALAIWRGQVPPGPSFTRHGTFWTGNVAEIHPSMASDIEVDGASSQPVQSLLLIPFEIQGGDIGLLQLSSVQKDFFAADTIDFYEGVAQTLGLAIADRRAQASLRERVKEMTCLYALSQIEAHVAQPLESRLQEIVDLLPDAWQYPESAMARMTWDQQTYATGDFDRAVHRQEAQIMVAGQVRGLVEVGYFEDRPEFVEGPFLPEERKLIEAVARDVGRLIGHEEMQQQRAQLEDQLRHADRLTMIGKLAAGLGHEINEPLSSILGFAQLLQESPALPDELKTDVDKIVCASLYAREIVRKVVLFAREKPLQPEPLRVNQLIEESLGMLSGRCADRGIDVQICLDEPLPAVLADPVQVRQLLVNLIVNAIQAMPDGGTLTLVSTRRDRQVEVQVRDTGIGMNKATMKKIFDPFFTTKDVGEGIGLGLSVVHGIVKAHEGSIDVESERGAWHDVCCAIPTCGSIRRAVELRIQRDLAGC